MADDPPIFADHWLARANEERLAARLLEQAKSWNAAFLHSGHAVEFTLKYRIMLTEGMNRWPDRGVRHELYIHDLTRLAELAGLRDAISAEVNLGSPLGLAWLIVKDWSVEVRYDPMPFSPARAMDMVQATDRSGLLEWLMTPRN